MDIKLDIIKTIRRLAGQGQNDILKNKLREWLQAKTFTLDELLFNCREGTIQLSGGLLNKMGSLYSSGKEGLNEDFDAAFTFFEMAAEVGNAAGNANCAQYYFDGRAPEGKNNELARIFCNKSIELGSEKYQLMAEILYDQKQYAQAVSWLHRILQSKSPADRKKRLEARQLERQCLQKQLSRIFHKINTYSSPESAMDSGIAEATAGSVERSTTPTRGIGALSRTPLSSVTTPYANPGARLTEISSAMSAAAAGTPRSRLLTAPANTISTISAASTTTELPGWVSISDQLDGFDRNACTALTTQAELLELEAHALRAAYETAQEHINTMRRNNLSEDIIALLNTTKVADFKAIYESVVQNKEMHVASWEAYTDTQEHIIRRQINAEQAYFSAKSTVNKLTQLLAVKLLNLRTADESGGDASSDPFSLNLSPVDDDGGSSGPAARIPTARCLITAERSLLDLAADIYPLQTYLCRQSTHHHLSSGGAGTSGVSSISVLRGTGWSHSDKTHHFSHPLTVDTALHTSSVASTANVTSTNTNAATTTGTPRPASPSALKSPMSSLRISTSESPMKPSGDRFASPALSRSASVGYMSPTATSAGIKTPKKDQQTSKSTNRSTEANGLNVEPHTLFTATEHILLDTTLINYRCRTTIHTTPTDRNLHHSGYIAEDIVTSDEALLFFNRITMVADDAAYVENEKVLSQLIQRFLHDGAPIQLCDLQCMNSDLNESDKVLLNKIVFHYFVRRVVRWLIPVNADIHGNIALPIASVHARTLKLIEQGIVTFTEAFERDGLYGVFFCDEQHTMVSPSLDPHHYHNQHVLYHNHNHLTTTLHNKGAASMLSLQHTTHSQHVAPLLALRNKVKHINALYQKYIVELAPVNFVPTIQYWKQHTTGATVPTYKLLYSELGRVYGGESDDNVDVDSICSAVRDNDNAVQVLLQKLQS